MLIDQDPPFVVELIGYYRENTLDLVYYLLEDGRHVEVVHNILESYENTDHQYTFSRFVEPGEVVAKSFSEASWTWIHATRRSRMVVGKHNVIQFT